MGTQRKGRFLLRHVSLVKYCCLVVFLSLLITMIQWMNVNTPSEFAAAKHSKFWRHNRKTIQTPAARDEVFNPIPRNVMDVSEYHAISVDGVEARHRRSQNNVKNRASRENPSDKERDSEEKVLTLGINDSQLFEHTANHTLNGIDSNQTNAKNNQSPDGAFRKRNHVKLPENKGQESRNKTLSTRKVKIIRRIMRRGKTIREEVVGVRTMHNQEVDIENAYIKSWYGVNRSLTAAKLQLTNTSLGDSLILTDDLWEFADQTSERLFLYGKLFQHNWQQNKTNTRRLREELRGIGMNAEENLLATRQNTPPNIGLPFYISTKVVVNKTKRRVPYFNATETFRRHLPDVSPFKGQRYRKCAVVGNSGILRKSSCGKEIDSFDMVFRCNAAPIEKFAEDAGRKTNLTTFNPSIFVTRYNSLSQTDDLDRFNSDMRQYSGIIMMTCFGAAQSFNTCAESLEHRTFTDPKLAIAHPSEIVNLWNYWKNMKTLKRPSTGFLIVHESIQLCEETHLYGFWPFPLKLDSTVQRVPYHYFDTSVPSQAHGMNTEFSIFVQYHELGIIRIHIGKC